MNSASDFVDTPQSINRIVIVRSAHLYAKTILPHGVHILSKNTQPPRRQPHRLTLTYWHILRLSSIRQRPYGPSGVQITS